jgi:hypothetical protein
MKCAERRDAGRDHGRDQVAHTVRGLVSILGSKGGEKIESSKTPAGERTYKIGK